MDGRHGDRWSGLVAELARMPDVIARLLAEHQADGYGDCQTCRGVQQGVATRWPCRLYGLAAAALDATKRGDTP